MKKILYLIVIWGIFVLHSSPVSADTLIVSTGNLIDQNQWVDFNGSPPLMVCMRHSSQ